MTVLQAYRKVYYGLMLILLDFRIGTLDILPDFIGYIFVVVGLGILAEKSQHFAKAKFFASILVITSLFDLVQVTKEVVQPPQQTGFFITPSVSSIPFLVFTLIAGLIRLAMVYYMCEGIWEAALKAEEPELAARAEYCKKIYLGFNYLWLLWMPSSLNFSEQWVSAVGVFLALAMFFIEISLITLVYGAGTKLGEDGL